MSTSEGFITWLFKQSHRDDFAGDLATDVRLDMDDGCLSSEIDSADQLREHIKFTHQADEQVLSVVDLVACEHQFLQF